ncbi:response regulator transcription factor [Sphingomonas sp. BK345]|uniref:response regulator transcription factor n=1 Tax=Sphingomonas sp. BK345 TaxID=2586980 RepID=UPI00185CF602|nr:response regulator transcription factor [Sphingomonas sp. BK345]MBB3475735.1 DNA-binding NarL/FixJ family response regulator [Sphingomonas sp. BK345]
MSASVTGSDSRIRLLIVDDHPALREGVAAMVQYETDIAFVGEAPDGEAALEAFERLRPDVTLMDLQMPGTNGIGAIRAIRERSRHARIIVLTTYDGDLQAVEALKAGAVGYLLKASLRRELLEAIRAVHSGRKHIPPEVAQQIALHAGEESLTPREIEILKLVADGHANKTIAWRLSLTEDTVKGHMKNILAKLNVHDRTQAVTTALRRGLFFL